VECKRELFVDSSFRNMSGLCVMTCEATCYEQMFTIPLMIDLNGLKLFSVDDLIKV
jgi:hypothetical protein